MTSDRERLKAIKDAHFRAGLGIGATYDGWVDAFGRADKVSNEAIALIEYLLRKQELTEVKLRSLEHAWRNDAQPSPQVAESYADDLSRLLDELSKVST